MGYSYTVAGQSVELEERPDLVAVRHREPAPHSVRKAFADTAGSDFNRRYEVPNEKFTLLEVPDAAPRRATAGVSKLAADPAFGIARTSPVFRIGDTNVFASDRVLVGLEDVNQPVAELLATVRHKEVQPRGNGDYVIVLPEDVDPLETASRLAASPGVRYSEPDFVNIGPRPGRAVRPAQTSGAAAGMLERQYAMQLTKAREAWQVSAGAGDIRIAVLDEGVDVRHPDLGAAVVGAYDAIDTDAFQDPNPWDGHGTACAGLAAAMPAGDGVRGVAGGCSLLAVRIASSAKPGGDWAWSNDRVATAIDWSWRNGADVLSNSWGGGAPSNRVVDAFRRALTQGRNGRGCVVVVAAGNDGRHQVSYPANLPGVTAVSASNEKDELKTRASSDGESWWGSNYGPEIAVAAPGVHNMTTDITGAGGYDGSGYYASFNGTSSATPLVAGAAALVLSVNPAMHGTDVHKLLCETADKVGPASYPGGRNDQFGHGRLNVLKAVRAAKAMANA